MAAFKTTNRGLIFKDRVQGKKGADIASATTITLGRGNYFHITGTTTISYITTTGWQPGSVVRLKCCQLLGNGRGHADPRL
jgi:hypothetical protein